MIRVMVADDNQATRSMLMKFLSSKPEISVVGMAGDGKEAEYMLPSAKPDVLLLDLVMPMVDGYELMSRMHLESKKRPRVIVLSSLMRDESIQRAMHLGASYYMLKPYDPELLYNRIVEFGSYEPEDGGGILAVQTRENRIAQVLHALHMPISCKGYDYLRMTLEMMQKGTISSCRVTKEIYPAVAKRYDTNAYAVERAIRGAIEHAWNRGELSDMPGFGGDRRPTNGELIARAHQMLKDS